MKKFLTLAGLSCDLSIKMMHQIDFGFILWATSVRRYLYMRQQGVNIYGFFYEDLIENKTFAVKKAFMFTGMPMELVEAGVKGLERNSQENSGISRKHIQRYADYMMYLYIQN